MGSTRPALLVIDVQKGFDSPRWGRRNHPDCEDNIARLISQWRDTGRGPLIYVRHDSAEPGSPLALAAPGNEFKDVITGEPDLLVTKQVHSAFHGAPDLSSWLRERGIDEVAVTGIASDHCCETTTRVGCDLGFKMTFVGDATHTFDRTAPDGTVIPAEEIQRATEASLSGEFALVSTTRELLGSLDVSAIGARHIPPPGDCAAT